MGKLPMQAMVVYVRVCLFSMAEVSVWVSHRVKLSLFRETGCPDLLVDHHIVTGDHSFRCCHLHDVFA